VPRVDEEFKLKVYGLVGSIPLGRLMTYGQIATLCGAPWAAWEVGQIAHLGPSNLPWHRVVNKKGGLASGYVPDGIDGHKRNLEAEGVIVNDEYSVNLSHLLWNPEP
jgi:methylated-DNA-protein-cysteine methyltransferase-like protein